MAVQIFEDLVAGHDYREDDRGGILTRVFRVQGLTSTSAITTDAIRSVDGAKRIPQAGDRHDKLPDLYCRAINVVHAGNSREAVRVYVTYTKIRRRLLDVQYNGSTAYGQSAYNMKGDLIRVGYKAGGNVTPPPPPKLGENSNGWDYQVANPSKLMPDSTLDITYLENASPADKIDNYRRKLNSKPWQGGKPREWLCTNITGRIESPIPVNLQQLGNPEIVTGDALFNWIVQYSFRRRRIPEKKGDKLTHDEPGWDPLVAYVDKRTGKTPDDVNPRETGWPTRTEGNGWKVEQVYGEADFNELNLVSAVI